MKEFDIIGLRVCEYQAKLFEASVEKFNCSSKIFLRRFMHSSLLKMLDKNNDCFYRFTIDEALDEINEEFGESDYGKEKFSSSAMYWIGYMYRYISYTREIDTRFLMKLFDVDLLNRNYFAFHTQDPEWCVRSLLELKELPENIFDPNYRLKMAIKAYREKNKNRETTPRNR